jgi:hypothetical protein
MRSDQFGWVVVMIASERIIPEEHDAFIDDSRSAGRCDASIDGKHLGTRGDVAGAVSLLLFEMERTSYWPNVWLVNDHGNTTLVILDSTEPDGYTFGDVAYV